MRVIFLLLAGTSAQRKTMLTRLKALNFVEELSTSSLLLHASNRSVGVEVSEAPRGLFSWVNKSRDFAVGGIRFEGTGSSVPEPTAKTPPFPTISFVRSTTHGTATPTAQDHIIRGVKEVALPVGCADSAGKVRSYLRAEGAIEKMCNVFELGPTHYRLLPSNVFSLAFNVDNVEEAGHTLRGTLEDSHALGDSLLYSYLGEAMDVRLDDSKEVLPFFREGHKSILEGVLKGVQSDSIWGNGAAGLRKVGDDCWGEVKEALRVAPARFLTETRTPRKPRQGSYLE